MDCLNRLKSEERETASSSSSSHTSELTDTKPSDHHRWNSVCGGQLTCGVHWWTVCICNCVCPCATVHLLPKSLCVREGGCHESSSSLMHGGVRLWMGGLRSLKEPFQTSVVRRSLADLSVRALAALRRHIPPKVRLNSTLAHTRQGSSRWEGAALKEVPAEASAPLLMNWCDREVTVQEMRGVTSMKMVCGGVQKNQTHGTSPSEDMKPKCHEGISSYK